jgi:uncharacterized protein YukE
VTVNPLVAGRPDDPKSPWAGIWIAEDIELIGQGVECHSWVDGTLGVVGAGLDALAFVSDPVGALLQYGVAWLIEHVKPLSEALDWLAGDPAQIAAHAQTWRNVATELQTEAEALTRAVRSEIPDWSGAAAEAYRTWAGQRGQSLDALAKASATLALITEGAGMLIGTVRIMVRDAVATVVSRLIVNGAELIGSLGVATPLVVEQVTTLCASWAAKIAHWLRDLISSLRNLVRESEKLGRLIELLKKALRSAPGDEPSLHREGDGIARNRERILMTTSNVSAVAAKYGIDLQGVKLVIDKVRLGSKPGQELFGITSTNGTVTLTRDAFIDEEQLARTLVHERFHVAEIWRGLRVPRDAVKLARWEKRAMDYEIEWWERHKHLLDD